MIARITPAAVLALLALPAWAADCRSLSSLDWLLGEWIADSGKSEFRESWTAVSPATWEGAGVETPKDNPAQASVEALRLVEMAGGVYYIAKVAHNELPVAFRLVDCGGDRLVFVNPVHDFPRRLEYLRVADDALRVRVSDAADRGFVVDFRRAAPAAAAPARGRSVVAE